MSKHRRIFIGGLGYTFLRDLSVGPLIVQELKQGAWPPGVEIDDLGPGGPIAAIHRFRELPPYDRVILVSSEARMREAGQIYCYRWDGCLPDTDEIQMRVSEAVTGVIGLDNLLIIGGYFGIWPRDVVVMEVEPCEWDWGAEFSEPVQAAFIRLQKLIRQATQEVCEHLPDNPYVAWKSSNEAYIE